MDFLKSIFGQNESELETVKRLLQESSGARDFLKRAKGAGFKVGGENFGGVTMEGKYSRFVFSVLESHGADKIFSLVFKDKRNSITETLIREGNMVFGNLQPTTTKKSEPSKDEVALLTKLKQGAEIWNEWRNLNPEAIIILHNTDLASAKLNKVNLSNSDLTGANLKDAMLIGANLTNAILINANLSRADLSDANLCKANLSGANLSGGVYFPRVNLTDANLTGVNMTQANIGYKMERKNTNIKLNGANLSNAILVDAYLNGADLSAANLQNADLNGAYLYDTNFTGANLSTVKNLKNAFMLGAKLTDAIMADGTKHT